MDIYAQDAGTWSGLVVEASYGAFYFLETRPGYGGQTTAGTRIGQELSQVRAAYGSPSYVVAGRQETYHVYEDNRIVFREDQTGSVAGWVLYGSE